MAIILASQSPRRKELLAQLGVEEFCICPAQGEEIMPQGAEPAALVEELSRQKAREVAEKCGSEDLVIGADTVVALEGTVLGKPGTPEKAAEMLRTLSDKAHQVYTGITLIRGEKELTRHECTTVHFRTLTEEEIAWYVSTGEPLDKAGAYGIQGKGARFIPSIEGDYSNVVGLPLCLLGQMLGEMGEIPGNS
jgi:septum formation protein